MSTHNATISTELIFGDGSEEILADVSFSVSRYYPMRGPSFNSPGEPAEGGEIEDLTVTRLYRVENKKVWYTISGSPPTIEKIVHELPCPEWLADMICENADLSALAEQSADDAYGDACDDAYDRARNARMEAM